MYIATGVPINNILFLCGNINSERNGIVSYLNKCEHLERKGLKIMNGKYRGNPYLTGSKSLIAVVFEEIWRITWTEVCMFKFGT